jgi:hypothetical protein
MSLSDLISKNLNFAIAQIGVSLTSVPDNGEIYLANKQDSDESFEVYEDGREEILDTKFYITISGYSNLPSKGTILTDGSTQFKVMKIQDDSIGVTRRLDCSSTYQR